MLECVFIGKRSKCRSIAARRSVWYTLRYNQKHGTTTTMIKSGVYLKICIMVPCLRRTGMALKICGAVFIRNATICKYFVKVIGWQQFTQTFF